MMMMTVMTAMMMMMDDEWLMMDDDDDYDGDDADDDYLHRHTYRIKTQYEFSRAQGLNILLVELNERQTIDE